MKDEINYGFIKPFIEEKHYILGQGNVPFKVLKSDGDWGNPALIKEYQTNLYIETSNCTGFNTAKQIEEYMLVAFGIKVNLSARWIGIIAGTEPPGNDPHKVYEAIRKYGVIPEEMLPFSDDIKSVNEYYSFKGADKDACYTEGKRWLEQYDFKHEWVFDPNATLSKQEKINRMNTALMFSPLGIAVYAWARDDRGVYIRLGEDTHWTSQYAQKDYQKIFDSYIPPEKDLEQEIFYAKRIHIEKKVPPQKSYLTYLFEQLFLALKQYGLIKS